jgi:hypothetical protein
MIRVKRQHTKTKKKAASSKKKTARKKNYGDAMRKKLSKRKSVMRKRK